MARYYLDTAIWIDVTEDRRGFKGEPLGEYGSRFLLSCLESNSEIVVSDVVIRELNQRYSEEQILALFLPFRAILRRMRLTRDQDDEAGELASERSVPRGDAQHAVVARDNGCVLVTRDRHFKKLENLAAVRKPEDLLV